MNNTKKYKFDNSLDERGKERHLHTLDGIPLTGTSSIVDVLNKPLSYYAAGMAIQKFGVPDYKVLGRIKKNIATEEEVVGLREGLETGLRTIQGLDIEGFAKLVDEAYRAHAEYSKKAAKKGTDLHAELEEFVKGCMGLRPVRDYDEKILPFIEWSKKEVKQFIWSEAHCYSEKLWVGGISDAGVILNDDTIAVIDFKSAKKAYVSHFIQDEGYAIQIEENGLWDCNGTKNKKLDKPIDALVVVPFGAEVVIPEVRRNIAEFKEGFRAAVSLYRLLGLEKQN